MKQSSPRGYIVQLYAQVLLLVFVHVANDNSLDGLLVHGKNELDVLHPTPGECMSRRGSQHSLLQFCVSRCST